MSDSGLSKNTVECRVWGKTLQIDPDEAKDEREHLERSLAERFNFLLVWVGLVTTAALPVDSDKDPWGRIIIFLLGLVVSLFTWVLLWRTFAKLLFTLSMMRAACGSHAGRYNSKSPMWPFRIGESWKRQQDKDFVEHVAHPPKFSQHMFGVMFIMAGWIPLLCTVGLAVLLIRSALAL